MSQVDFYNQGTRVWFPDQTKGFVPGTVISNNEIDGKIKIVFDIEGREKNHELLLTKEEMKQGKNLPYLRNPPVLEGIDDLTLLSHLHEPAVLHNVKLRYSQEQIYTYSGIVLIALNPFQRLPIYTHDIMRAYSGKRRGELEPHLFAVAEEAYRNMLKENRNQSIIVSGESGAGKTQSAKYIMRYFATVDDLDKNRTEPETEDTGISMSEVEEAVLATNPIMEAFGNAKTTRNDNSSRFGKYIEIQFLKDPESQRVKICGAKTRTYLLERSRLVFQPLTERNYHIFYQLCAGCPAAERKELGITSFDQYHYLNQGGEGTIPGVDDVEEFAITQRALSAIGIPVSLQWSIFKLCAALLHIGNIEIIDARNDDSQINANDPALEIASKLLGVSPTEFSKWIVKKQIRTRMETIVANRKTYDALVCRDSIAKFLYSKLFDWLVNMINKNLAYEKKPKDELSFIGVLDIYGFEHFQKNSFEQFCINYANEKLQQEFNQHVFKLEQDEYVNEKIEWSFIDFNDNQPCIDMIENRFGILALLDEECRLPSGSDKSLISKLYQKFDNKESKFFKKPRFSQNEFTIAHYALDVTYQIEGFIEKNKDTVSDEQLDLLQKSTNEFIKELTQLSKDIEEASPTTPISPNNNKRMSFGFSSPTSPKRLSMGMSMGMGLNNGGNNSFKPKNKKTLGSIFKASLIDLMTTIRSTDAHYIRCIKPNQAKEAFEFEPMMVLSQLRACGVLETIRISCAGYPTRWTFQEFVERYYLLIHSKEWDFNDPKAFSLKIVKNTIKDEDKFQVGLTKIFFRTGMLAYLEKLRSDKLKKCVVFVQKNARRFVYQRRYEELKKSAILVQNHIRSAIARHKLRELSEEHAAIIIQKYTRRFLARDRYNKMKSSALTLQTHIRSYFARKALTHLRRERAAIIIQKVFRGQRASHKYQQAINNIIFVQSCIRRHFAAKEFKTLKAEAKSITYMKKLNYQLENKVFELSQSLTQKEKDNKQYKEKIKTMDSQIQIWKEKFERLDTRFKENSEQVNEGSAEQKREIAELKENRSQLEARITLLKTENAKIVKSKEKELEELRQQLQRQIEENNKLRENMKNLTKPSEDTNMVNQLKREVLSLKDQLQKSIVGKLKGEGPTEGYGTEAYLLDADERVGRPVSIGRHERGRSKSNKRRPLATASAIQTPTTTTATNSNRHTLQSSQSAPALPIYQEDDNNNKNKMNNIKNNNNNNILSSSSSSSMNNTLPSKNITTNINVNASISSPSPSTTILTNTSLNHTAKPLVQSIETHITEAFRRKSMPPPKKEPSLTLVIPSNTKFNSNNNNNNNNGLNSAPVTNHNLKNSILRKSESNISALTSAPSSAHIRNMEEECRLKILEDESLEHEIIEGLIMNLRIPLPSSQAVSARKDILFPAHIIGSCMQKLLNHGLLARLQVLSSKVMRSIQSLATRFEDDYVSCFWLSNTFELMCVLERIKLQEDGGKRMNHLYTSGQDVLNKISNDLEYLLVELYHGWMKELKKRISNMAIPAIIENQSLPNFYCNKSGGLWSKIKSAPQTSYTIEQLTTFLSKISMVLRCYFMEESIARQILCELMRILSVTAFNHLIMRKNFCTWKRGMQIQYNLSRLEEWCDEHQIPEGSLHLERLVQAAKLLQLNKTTYHDIETIFNVCFLLNSTQIKKLLSLYYPIDFENPVSSDILRSISQRSNSEMNNNLLLDTEDSIFDRPPLRPVDKIDTSGMPTWSDLFLIKCLLEVD